MNFYESAKELVSKMTVKEKLSQMNYLSPAIERLGIPAYSWWNECLHGLARSGVATVFPQSIAIAASFDASLTEKVADAISTETRAKYNEYKKQGFTDTYQGLTMCAPNINIFRDPRWGRGHETYGEDPYLTAVIATAYIKGLQGNGKYRKCDATLKHFAVHSGPESGRSRFNTEVSEKDLYETYLKAFEYCIKNADPSAVMGAYNAVNGEPCTASKTLLKDILRERFGFGGYVESDAGGVENLNKHHKLTKTMSESAALSVNNGCDLCIGEAYESLPEAFEKGLVNEDTITKAVTRLFAARFKLGMFANDCEYDSIPYSAVDCKEHRELNLKMAQDSIVLLKNDGILPLKKGTNIAIIGPNADDKSILLANYNGTPKEYSTILAGLIEKSTGNTIYAKGCHHSREAVRDDGIFECEAILAAKYSDAVIMVMGLSPSMEGEESDSYSASLAGDKPGISLPDVQLKLYEAIKKTGKPIIFVNVSGSCVSLCDQKENCSAIIQCFYPGARGGEALADVIYGSVSPSGRLPVTFYKSDSDLPDFKDYSMKNRTYKYFKGEVCYPFGFGLTYSDIIEERISENEIRVTNCGKTDTAYSVLNFKENPLAKDNEPIKELIGFKKIFLKSGETQTVSF